MTSLYKQARNISYLLLVSPFNFIQCQWTLFAPNTIPAAQERICNPDNSYYAFSGYRIDRQITIDKAGLTHSTHLVICKEGASIQDLSIPQKSHEDVPWLQDLCPSTLKFCLRLVRLKTSKLRELVLFYPGTWIGGVFERRSEAQEFTPSTPLVASNLFNQWLEVKHTGLVVYHIPLFNSPDVRSKMLSKSWKRDWATSLSANESYSIDSRLQDEGDRIDKYIVKKILEFLANNGRSRESLSFFDVFFKQISEETTEGPNLLMPIVCLTQLISRDSYIRFVSLYLKLIRNYRDIVPV